MSRLAKGEPARAPRVVGEARGRGQPGGGAACSIREAVQLTLGWNMLGKIWSVGEDELELRNIRTNESGTARALVPIM